LKFLGVLFYCPTKFEIGIRQILLNFHKDVIAVHVE